MSDNLIVECWPEKATFPTWERRYCFVGDVTEFIGKLPRNISITIWF